MPRCAQAGKRERINEWQRQRSFFRRQPAIRPTKNTGDHRYKYQNTGQRMQDSSMETQESAGPSEVADVVQIGGHSGNDQDGGAKSRQALLRGARQRQ